MSLRASAINAGRLLSPNHPALSFHGSNSKVRPKRDVIGSGYNVSCFSCVPILLLKQHLRSATSFVLLAIFLAVQWASPHAHLTGTHEHSGDRHHHSAEIHAHHAVSLHLDAIDSADLGHLDVADTWVVDLDHPQLPSGGQQPDPRPVALVAQLHIPIPTAPGSFRLPEAPNPLPDLLPAHIGQPRAPPHLA